VSRLRRKSGGKISPIRNQSRIAASSRGWMSELGLRRSFFGGKLCPECGEVRLEIYRRHPFPVPPPLAPGHWLLSDCTCVKKERTQVRLNQQNLLIRPGPREPLPIGLRDRTFENFQVTAMNRKSYNDCLTFARRFPKIPQGRGILLMGPSGTGKTHLACAIVNALKDTHAVWFANVPMLLERMRTSNVSVDELLSADLLVLDDIGSERETAWTVERLLLIVDTRLSNLKPTVFTTNYEIKDFEARVGMRLASRIVGHNLHVFLMGPDWRLSRR